MTWACSWHLKQLWFLLLKPGMLHSWLLPSGQSRAAAKFSIMSLLYVLLDNLFKDYLYYSNLSSVVSILWPGLSGLGLEHDLL